VSEKQRTYWLKRPLSARLPAVNWAIGECWELPHSRPSRQREQATASGGKATFADEAVSG
jgi:hypothetical protein